MAEIINLRQARKTKARTEAEATATQNRLTHGRSKAERTASETRSDLDSRRHESHRREQKPEPGSAADQ